MTCTYTRNRPKHNWGKFGGVVRATFKNGLLVGTIDIKIRKCKDCTATGIKLLDKEIG